MAMRIFRGFLTLAFVAALGLLIAPSAQAQDRVFLQIEAHPDLATAEARVRAYAQLVENVNGFRATTGLYAVALGPYEPDLGRLALQQLLAQGLIPRDSFLEDGDLYATQFFPVGANALGGGALPLPTDTGTQPVVAAEEQPAAPALIDETPDQARQSEALLTREERDALQISMQYFGFYTSTIDGDFGPGTRAAMQAYQQARGMEPTGILTTRQRAQLLGEVQADLATMGMEPTLDARAGIQIDMPMALVQFDSYNFPFAQYESRNDSGVRALLISQPGDRGTLFGLYEIMQTLDIVPLEGERQRQGDSFVLTGQSPTLRSHTEARLVGGAVKGFTLIWPPEQDDLIARVLPLMQASFQAVDGALDPGAVPEGLDESIDLVSGLTVRRPAMIRSGFYLDARGTVLTTTEVVGQCEQVLIDNAYDSTVAFRDDALGIAILTPTQQLAPLAFARMVADPARLRAEIAVAGYPFDGALSSASTSFGTLAELSGLNGEETVQRLEVETEDTEAGGPVLDIAGGVIGMVLPGNIGGRTLPDDVTLALRADRLVSVLQGAGINVSLAQPAGAMNRENISREAADMTVRVSCWN